jgi:hypothetical protein
MTPEPVCRICFWREGHHPLCRVQLVTRLENELNQALDALATERAALAEIKQELNETNEVLAAAREIDRITWQGLLDTEGYAESSIKLRAALAALDGGTGYDL